MPYTFNPLTGQFDYYQTATGATGPQGPAGPMTFGRDGDDGEDGLSIVGAPGAPATPGNAAYGEMVIINNATGLAMTLQNTAYQVVAGWQVDDTNGFTFAGSALTTQTAGAFFTTCSVSVQSTSSNQVYNFQVFRNGVAIPAHNALLKLTNSADINSITVVGTIDGVNKNDVFTLWATNQTSAGQTLTVSYANFSITAIQGSTGQQGIAGFGFDGEPGEDGFSIAGAQGVAGTNGTIGRDGLTVIGQDGVDGEDSFAFSMPLYPATTVVTGTTASQTPAVGVSLNYAREDHTHGTPAAGAGSNWTTVKNSVGGAETLTIGSGFQFLCWNNFVNNNIINNSGDMVIL
jgi:hypothetical protein